MYPYFRPLLFRLEPERAHSLTIRLLKIAGDVPLAGWLLRKIFIVPQKKVQVLGLDFSNPVGLAAGYDKDGLAWRGLVNLGFGHIEVGTVTLKPQLGNPRPRVFRLLEDQALINRMGFPGKGVDFLEKRISGKRPSDLILGVNIGKNRDTPLDQAGSEYAVLIRRLTPLVDYIAINISSPNTVGLRRLQARSALENLLEEVSLERMEQEKLKHGNRTPFLVKLAPDLSSQELEDAIDVILAKGIDGIIATNTTLERRSLVSQNAGEQGGLSGVPLYSSSLDKVRQIVRLSAGKLPVIGVGGIMTPENAQEMLDVGAVLVQIYTGLIYSGPGLVSKIVRSLSN